MHACFALMHVHHVHAFSSFSVSNLMENRFFKVFLFSTLSFTGVCCDVSLFNTNLLIWIMSSGFLFLVSWAKGLLAACQQTKLLASLILFYHFLLISLIYDVSSIYSSLLELCLVLCFLKSLKHIAVIYLSLFWFFK